MSDTTSDFKWYEITVCIGQDSHENAVAVLIDAVYDAVDTVMEKHPEFATSDIWSTSAPSDHRTEEAYSRLREELDHTKSLLIAEQRRNRK